MPLRGNRDAMEPPTMANDFNTIFRRVLAPNPYSTHQPPSSTYPSRPQPPPSPPRETGGKPSLPSISSLLNPYEDERPSQAKPKPVPASTTPQVGACSGPAPNSLEVHPQKGSSQETAYQASEVRYDGVYKYPPHPSSFHNSSNNAAMLPPTPPLAPERDRSRNRTYSNSSYQSLGSTAPYQLGSSLNNMDPHQQRVVPSQQFKRYSMPLEPTVSPYLISPYAASSPGGVSVVSSFYSPASDTRASHSPYDRRLMTSPYRTPAAEPKPYFPLHEQRPLPGNFPPTNPLGPPPHPSPSGSTASNPTEHHHYIGGSSQASFQQAQERYVCPTCKKAFSRPSSLRIHSHSHSGEKPFRCPHGGCGKTFSVRSNMKRHERGCHARPGQAMTEATATASA